METEAGMEMMQKQNRKKILIIDDDVKIGDLEQEVLEQVGVLQLSGRMDIL